jgi:hypothetical protein
MHYTHVHMHTRVHILHSVPEAQEVGLPAAAATKSEQLQAVRTSKRPSQYSKLSCDPSYQTDARNGMRWVYHKKMSYSVAACT